MKSAEIKKRFVDYFVGKNHVEVPSSPLVPERHPTLLFVNSGMVQFTPYFLGEKDPNEDFGSNRLCSVQKSIRTIDLDVVGKSKYHLTFFEMLGSWSIGDYGKQKAVEFAYDLLTNTKYGYGLDPSRFIPTVFEGNDEAQRDDETIKAWRSAGIPDNNISRLPASENWWAPAGLEGPGPCGPCTEILYDRGSKFGPKEKTPGMTDNPRYVEIWNAGVFIQFNRDENGKLHELDTMSVDTGAGLERFAVLLQGVDSVYETDLFTPTVKTIERLIGKKYGSDPITTESIRIIADHLRASVNLLSEGLVPSNKVQGYVLRKLIRRSVFRLRLLGFDTGGSTLSAFTESYKKDFESVLENWPQVKDELDVEAKKFDTALNRGLKKLETILKSGKVDGSVAFDLYQTEGFPLELTLEILEQKGENFSEQDKKRFEKAFDKHKQKSRTASEGMFKGGLLDTSDETVKLHTVTHLLNWALRETLGDHVVQKGSNITTERLRFDFSNREKLTENEIENIEQLINQKIKEDHPVGFEVMPTTDAEQTGAIHAFGEKYGDRVKIYFIGEDLNTAFSKEFCGGPHVSSTGVIGRVKISKQEKIGSGILRIYADFDHGSK